MRPSLQLFFRVIEISVPCSSLASPRRNSSTNTSLTQMPRNEAKIYQETNFLSTEGHLLTSFGCFLTSTSSLEVIQVRFAFVSFVCELSYLISLFFRKSRMVYSSSKLRRGRFFIERLVGSFFVFCLIVLTEF